MTTTFMSSPKLLFTSESVTEGHPDKLCDQIADSVLDACFEQDPQSRVACEVATKTGYVMLLGEITTHAFVNFDELVRKVVVEIGYDRAKKGFDGNTCGVLSAISSQSPDIDMGVSKSIGSQGWRPGPDRPDRRRGPGYDVRLCLQRDRPTDAHAHLPGS